MSRIHLAARLTGAGLLAASLLTVPAAAVGVTIPSDHPGGVCVDRHGHATADARPGPGSLAPDRNSISSAQVDAMQSALEQRLALPEVQQAIATSRGRIVPIPVVIHEVHSTRGKGRITNETWRRQIRELNQNFAGGESPKAADTDFRFDLTVVNEYVNNNWFRNASTDDDVDDRMKRTTRQGGYGTLNVWSISSDVLLGYATFPSSQPGAIRTDGVVINYGSVPGGFIENYNLGKTLTHEAGHWLGLFHTFQDGCEPNNDLVNDTPAQKSPTFGCPVGRDSCFLPGRDPIRNYMDYSYDSCYTNFTDGQRGRMREFWFAYRA